MAFLQFRRDVVADLGRYVIDYGRKRKILPYEVGIALLYVGYGLVRRHLQQTQIHEVIDQLAAWDHKNAPPDNRPAKGS